MPVIADAELLRQRRQYGYLIRLKTFHDSGGVLRDLGLLSPGSRTGDETVHWSGMNRRSARAIELDLNIVKFVPGIKGHGEGSGTRNGDRRQAGVDWIRKIGFGPCQSIDIGIDGLSESQRWSNERFSNMSTTKCSIFSSLGDGSGVADMGQSSLDEPTHLSNNCPRRTENRGEAISQSRRDS